MTMTKMRHNAALCRGNELFTTLVPSTVFIVAYHLNHTVHLDQKVVLYYRNTIATQMKEYTLGDAELPYTALITARIWKRCVSHLKIITLWQFFHIISSLAGAVADE